MLRFFNEEKQFYRESNENGDVQEMSENYTKNE